VTVIELIERLRTLPPEATVVLNADRNGLAVGKAVGRVEATEAVLKKDGDYSPTAVGLYDEEEMREYGYEIRKIVNLTPS